MTWRILLPVSLLVGLGAQTPAQSAKPGLAVETAAGSRPLLRLDGFLADRELQQAVESGLPLRIRVRIELWRDGFFDDLNGSVTWNAVVAYDPLARQYLMRTRGSAPTVRRSASYEGVRAAVEGARSFELRPLRRGRYYYTATAEIETLSLSDLEELERWLRGELGPAVTGERSIPRAIGEGAKRLLIRVLDLPTRSLELKTAEFRVR